MALQLRCHKMITFLVFVVFSPLIENFIPEIGKKTYNLGLGL
jgi:hypothetical protein